ncbi:MAG: hypothetical protein L0215_17350 [Gemmataceae bacterium]|nr:hypothetical protein [Gemmataceae bacterium]
METTLHLASRSWQRVECRKTVPLRMDLFDHELGLVCVLEGVADAIRVKEMQAHLLTLAARCPGRLVVDLSGLCELCEAALGAFEAFCRFALKIDAALKLVRAPDPVLCRLAEARLLHAIELYDGVVDALWA